MAGSLTLVAGNPGVGKSTVRQLLHENSRRGYEVHCCMKTLVVDMKFTIAVMRLLASTTDGKHAGKWAGDADAWSAVCIG